MPRPQRQKPKRPKPRQRYGPAVVIGTDGVPRIVTMPRGEPVYQRVPITAASIRASKKRT
jgi:hypothetical protein